MTNSWSPLAARLLEIKTRAHGLIRRKFNFKHLLFKIYSDIVNIFWSVQP